MSRLTVDPDMLATHSGATVQPYTCGARYETPSILIHSLPILPPSLIPPSFPSSPFAPSLPLFLPISALTHSSFPPSPHLIPPLLASPTRNCTLVLIDPLHGCLPMPMPAPRVHSVHALYPVRMISPLLSTPCLPHLLLSLLPSSITLPIAPVHRTLPLATTHPVIVPSPPLSPRLPASHQVHKTSRLE
ncbi:hypothetical protein B0H14DRAFT_3471159 [Mycena olivaceomarginata]|nr:hypothetical protein B0H14DRAFT_3471159 [Mycena olivaceomarginata]